MSYERNRTLSWWAGLLIAVLLCSGCIKVSATSPADGATGVACDAVIQVTFSANANASTVNTGTFLVQDTLGNAVSGTVTYASKVATFTPASRLALMRGYTVTLTKGIKDTTGFALSTQYTFDFTTGDGAWGKAELIETNNAGNAALPQIAFDADGNAVAIWQQSDGTRFNIFSNCYTPSGGWGHTAMIQNFNSENSTHPAIAINDDGIGVAVWMQHDGTRWNIWSNHYTPGGVWGSAQLIETDNTGDAMKPQIAVDADGNAIAIWMQYDGTQFNICSNHYTPLGGWDVAQVIETDAGITFNPQIAVDADGNAMAVWMQSDGTRWNIWSNRYTPGSGWGTAQLIETDNGDAQNPQIVIAADGVAMAVWQQYDGTRYSIWSNRYTPGSGWGTAQLIETDNEDAESPQIAISADGVTMVVWMQNDGTRFNIWSNRYTPGGEWGTAQLIETYAGDAEGPQIAVDAAGNAVAVWSQSDGTRYNMWSNRYTSGGGWGTAQLIETDNAGTAEVSDIAVDAAGNAVAVWYQSDGTRYNIWANRFE